MDRRKFLRNGALFGCSAAASPLFAPIAFASAPWDNRLVVIILRGAMDGLDAVRPVGDADWAGLRPTIGGLPGPDLTGFFALHPALAHLMPLWRAGEVGFAHAVSTPYRDKRSHFDGQDILEAGVASLTGGQRDGWLNRLMQTVPGISAETAFAVGREQMLILTGAAPVSAWSPEARLRLSQQTRSLMEMVLHDDPLFRSASAEALAIVDSIALGSEADDVAADLADSPMMAGVTANGDHIKLAEFAATRLRGETRIASFSIGGWDTHQQQTGGLTRSLTALADTILTLRAGLGPVWEKTGVICMTEFGRTARENGTRGTDHGTGGAMVYAGGALRGGQVVTDWPGLAEADLYAGRDLLPTRDVRAHAGWIMRGLFGVAGTVIENAVFPGLDLGADPGLVL